MENDEAPSEAAKWQATFTMDEVIAAAKDAGAVIDKVDSLSVGQRGESGRAKTLLISGKRGFRTGVSRCDRLDEDALVLVGKPEDRGWSGEDER